MIAGQRKLNMSSVESLRMLVRYKAWADTALFSALAEVAAEVLVQEQKIVFGSIIRTLNHVRAMDVVWRSHLEGGAHGFTTRNPADCPQFPELRAEQTALDQWFVAYVDVLRCEQLRESIGFSFIGGGDGNMSRAEILMHVVNHTTYHRGHVAGMLYEANVPPPTTDLPVFLRQ